MLDVTVDGATLQRTIDRRVVGMFPAAKKAAERGGEKFRKWFISQRMSGRKGSVGLYKRTGKLRGALKVKVTGDRLDRLRIRVGWFTNKEAQIATVHEKGMTIYGRPWLVFRMLGPRGKDYGWKKVRKVRIPKRLEFAKKWREYRKNVVGMVRDAMRKVLKRG